MKVIPKKIEKLIEDLANQEQITNMLVRQIMENSKISAHDIQKLEQFDHHPLESYGRKIIHDNGNFKIILISWRPGDCTAIHNHGSTEWGCVSFFGDSAHRLYQVEDNRLIVMEKETYTENQVASICGNIIHLMGNNSNRKYSTLHIYGAGNRESNFSHNTKVYLPELEKVAISSGPAYLAMRQEWIQEEKPIMALSEELLSDYFELVRPFFERNEMWREINNLEKQWIHSGIKTLQ